MKKTTQCPLSLVSMVLAAGIMFVACGANCVTVPPVEEPPVVVPVDPPGPVDPPPPPPPPPPPAIEVRNAADEVVSPGTVLSVTTLTRLTVARPSGSFRVLFGPRPGIDETAQLIVTSQSPFLILLRGWIYADGVQPVFRARRLVAVAASTQMIGQIDIEANVDRLFLRTITGTEQATIEKLSVAAAREDSLTATTQNGDVVVVSSLTERTLVPPAPIGGPGDAAGDFYRAALAAAQQVGFPN